MSWCRLDNVTSQLTAEVLSLRPRLTHALSAVVTASHQLTSGPNGNKCQYQVNECVKEMYKC